MQEVIRKEHSIPLAVAFYHDLSAGKTLFDTPKLYAINGMSAYFALNRNGVAQFIVFPSCCGLGLSKD